MTRITVKFAAAAIACALASPLALGQAATQGDKAGSKYQKERADCDSGRTAQDRATCLKEAGAAQVERKRNTLDNAGSSRQNALDRCKALPQKDQADCIARIEGPNSANQTTTTSGSVAGGGVVRETRTVTPGTVTVIVPPQPMTPPTPPAPPAAPTPTKP